MWHYHLSIDGKALCGEKMVMMRELRLDSWGFCQKDWHIPYGYCKVCDNIAKKGGLL